MTVEITSVSLKDGICRISAIDCSEENLHRIERTRDDGFEREVEFVFNTKNKTEFLYLRNWLKRQKITRDCKTYGEALNSILGTITSISGKYRELA